MIGDVVILSHHLIISSIIISLFRQFHPEDYQKIKEKILPKKVTKTELKEESKARNKAARTKTLAEMKAVQKDKAKDVRINPAGIQALIKKELSSEITDLTLSGLSLHCISSHHSRIQATRKRAAIFSG